MPRSCRVFGDAAEPGHRATRRLAILWMAVLAVQLASSSAWAASISRYSLSRQTRVDYYVYLDSSYAFESWDDYDWEDEWQEGSFDSDLSIVGGGWEGTHVEATATQRSNVLLGAGLITASGSASGSTDYVSGGGGEGECCEWWVYEDAMATGSSSLHLVFDVLEPVGFSIDFLGSGNGGSFTFGYYRGADLFSGTWRGGRHTGTLEINERGYLEPGRYALDVIASSNEGTTSFDLAMVVPEPGTAMLVGTGIAAMAWRRRRQRLDDGPPSGGIGRPLSGPGKRDG